MNTLKMTGCMAGYHISHVANQATQLAKKTRRVVRFDFNEATLYATPKKSTTTILWEFEKHCNDRYHNSKSVVRRAAWNLAYEKREAEKAEKLRIALLTAPASMTLRDEPAWRKSVEVNSDGYGSAVMRYAEVWARLMEGRIASGDTVTVCAEEASHLADTEGMTGFMYGCAVSILAQVWAHGEALRRWHNKETQLGTEGDRANETGGVLNPALLVLR